MKCAMYGNQKKKKKKSQGFKYKGFIMIEVANFITPHYRILENLES